jgi:hypothetical protein
MRKLVANRIKTPDGTVLQSFYTHDYKNHQDKNGFTYMVDGGIEYLRRTIIAEAPAEELSVYTDDPFALIRRAFHWGTRGKDGKESLKWKPLLELDTDHIEAIIETQKQVPEHLLNIFKQELEWRKNEI